MDPLYTNYNYHKMTDFKMTLAKLFLGLCFLGFSPTSYAQMHHFNLQNNEMVNGFVQLTPDKALIYGQQLVDNKPEGALFEIENDTIKQVDLPQEVDIINLVDIKIISDTLFVFGSYQNLLDTVSSPFMMKLDRYYNLIQFDSIALEPNDYTFGTPLYTDNKFFITFNKNNGNHTSGIYFTLLNKNADIEASTFINNNSNSTFPFFCSSLTEGFDEGTYLFSLIKPNGEEIYQLDTNFNASLLKKLAHKPNATFDNEGYIYSNSYGAKVLNNKLYFSIEYRQLRLGSPSQQFLSIYQFNKQLDSITITNTGVPEKSNEIGGFEYSNNHFYIAGFDEALGFYPPKEYHNNIVVSKVDTTGSIVWSTTYGDSSNFIVRLVRGTEDGGCLVVGSRYLEGTTQYLDPFVLKVNTDGEITSIITLEKPNIGIYPNPTYDGNLTVQLPMTNNSANWQYKVSNALGQQLQEGTLSVYHNSIQLNGDLPCGNYFITFFGDNTLPVTTQVVKQ
jgi:hypothetical protein